ncbi:Signal transduction histidine kinase [Saccharopolyspora kobensis]|uniref:histidine kinase n=1 Tax=Saccharopolyspora kobensis TaxID=146035 RepID=A0A1H6AAF4_9PSEU|nr:histidine kinase [Saccharopolyspora kobensis]SEG45688.1 Signal transduction histidine kinase [Saccharopolyspora kobensis]SFE53327.1 Signal transduction histidine kinase [Saccharopolyspora kobensis]
MSAPRWTSRVVAVQTRGNLALWLVLAVLVLAERNTQEQGGAPWWLVLGGVVLLFAAGAAVRAFPVLSWLVIAALALGQFHGTTVGPPVLLSYLLALVVAGHQAGRAVEDVRPPMAAFAVAVASGLLAVIALGYLLDSPLPRVANNLVRALYLLVLLVLFGVLPWLTGRYRRLNAGLMAAGWERARQLEREQRIETERERLRERARIAQDMHDSLGHALSLIALRAGRAELDPAGDERLRSFAGEIRSAVTAAAEELHTVVGVLREDGSPPAPTEPVHESVAELVARTALSGVDVRLERSGEPVPLRAIAEHAVYRVVQEALTNATKHAPGAPVTVRLAHGVDETTVEVVNGPGEAPAPSPGRRGLIGLEERIRIAGGTMTAGPQERGFRVTATVPHADPGTAPDRVEPGEQPARFDEEQRRIRWRIAKGLALPVGLSTAVVVVVLGLFTAWVYNSVLPAETFDGLRLGTSRAEAEAVLPAFDLRSIEIGAEPARPAGSECGYYLTSAVIGPVPEAVYRLCFADERLVSKDVVQVRG